MYLDWIRRVKMEVKEILEWYPFPTREEIEQCYNEMPLKIKGIMAIEKQIWIDLIKEGLYPDSSFLTESVDMSELVEYNKINLAEAGIDPEVLIDNTVFPVPVMSREDIPKELALHTFDTVNTVVRNIEEKES